MGIRCFHKCLLIVISFATCLPAFADDTEFRIREAQQSARISLLTAERVLYAADQAIDAAARIISTIDNERLIHEEIKRLAQGVPGVRALIVIGPDGRLKYDSYRYPVTDLDLSDRDYYREAARRSGLAVGQTVVGRTSGLNFVPISRRSGDFTVAAIAGQYSMVDIETSCADCWAGMVRKDGELVSVFPPESEFDQKIYDLIADEPGNSGTKILRQHQSIIVVAWARSLTFPIISFGIRGLPDTAHVEIDVN